MSNVHQQQGPQQATGGFDLGDVALLLVKIVLGAIVVLIALPLVVPFLAVGLMGEAIATKARFWITYKYWWIVNTAGVLIVAGLVAFELVLLIQWTHSGQATTFLAAADWKAQLLPTFGPWAFVNLTSGIFLLPVVWSWHRRRIARLVQLRRISDVVRQERIEKARKRASDLTSAKRIGVTVDGVTGNITGARSDALTAPLTLENGRYGIGVVNQSTVRGAAEILADKLRVANWTTDDGRFVALPAQSGLARALVLSESGTGKTVMLFALMLAAVKMGWKVFFIDAKGDPQDADDLAELVRSYGATASVADKWNMLYGEANDVTAKIMRLQGPSSGDGAYYQREIKAVLQALQAHSPIRSMADMRKRVTAPAQHVRDEYDLAAVNRVVDAKLGTTAGQRVAEAVGTSLREFDELISEDGWTFDNPASQVTIVPLMPVDPTQAALGDQLLLEMRNYLRRRKSGRQKDPVLFVVDEFPQLVTADNDPADLAASLYETMRSANGGLILAGQNVPGLSPDESKRARALESGAAVIFGRQKNPDPLVSLAGTDMRMEASGAAAGDELRAARAQHTYRIPPDDVREANNGQFWIVNGGGHAAFRVLPNEKVDTSKLAGVTAESID